VGRPHLVDPCRLWQGSLKVLGHKAEVYGEPMPVPEPSLVDKNYLSEHNISVVATPGHAPHHVSFFCGANLFLGESAGTYSSLGKPKGSMDCYLRPATPPRFFPEIADQSLQAMLNHTPFSKRLCFAHHGQFEGDGIALLKKAQGQLKTWVMVVSQTLAEVGVDPAEETSVQALFPDLMDQLRKADPFFARGEDLPTDIKQREEDFTRQTIRGITGFLAS